MPDSTKTIRLKQLLVTAFVATAGPVGSSGFRFCNGNDLLALPHPKKGGRLVAVISLQTTDRHRPSAGRFPGPNRSLVQC